VKLAGKPYEIHLLAVIVLYVLGFAIYLNSFAVPFVFDDFPNIRDNPSIRLTTVDAGGIRAAAFESHSARRPVANVSFALNYVVGGYDVKGYHLVNIFIHVVNGVLVYFLALILLHRSRTISGQSPLSDRRLRLVALLAAAIFVAHPLQVQAVTYIVQRMTSMATMFYLMSLLFYLLGRRRGDLPGRWAWWAASLAAWLLALGSKETAATLPVIVLTVELLFYRDPSKTWPGTSPALLLFAILASAGVVLLYLGTDPAAAIVEQYALRDFSPVERFLTELRVLVFYLTLMVFPYPGRLSLDHAFSVSHSLIDPASTLLAAVLLAVLIVVALRLTRRHPIPALCILSFFVTLSIESSLIGLELVFEHRLYLPMVGFALAVAYLFSVVPARHPALVVSAAAVLVVVLAAASILRNQTWQNPVTLWTDTVSKNPSSHRARNNLGRSLADQGEVNLATEQFQEAIRLAPDYAEPHNNLGALHARAGRVDQALAHFVTAIELSPRYAQAYNNLGVALLRQGQVRRAASQIGRAVQIAPRYAKAHANLSVALARLGQPEESCRHLLIALRLDPGVAHSESALESCQSNSNTN
jgi:tetratricopeptide (TPR) repeat protein